MITHDDMIRSLRRLRPDSAWRYRGNDYSGLTWLDQSTTQPTEQEILDEIAQMRQDEIDWGIRAEQIKADAFVQEWENRLRKKTPAEIIQAYDNATQQQKDNLFKAMILRWAMEVR